MWLELGSTILRRKRLISLEKFQEHFKLPVPLVRVVYEKILTQYVRNARHLLWTLHYLFTTNTKDNEVASLLGTNKKTLRFHVRRTLIKLLNVLPQVSLFLFYL